MTGPTEPGAPGTGADHPLSPDVRLAVAESRLTRAGAESIIRDYVILGSTLTMAPLPLIEGDRGVVEGARGPAASALAALSRRENLPSPLGQGRKDE